MHATGGLRRHPWTLVPVVHPEHGDRPQEQETPTSQTQRAPCWAGAPQPLTTQAGLSTQSLRQNSRDHQCPDQTLPDCASCWGYEHAWGGTFTFWGPEGIVTAAKMVGATWTPQCSQVRGSHRFPLAACSLRDLPQPPGEQNPGSLSRQTPHGARGPLSGGGDGHV